jgi:hypothetical protein
MQCELETWLEPRNPAEMMQQKISSYLHFKITLLSNLFWSASFFSIVRLCQL